ncbi:diguanylate cyclase domain-containing protein [Methylobacterium sp. E-045]|uniref:diguanylate cyclase domain-containing protein n=1 Tax=Methylobacterium sp. E-045 TaxID=2836575 RepID=UPI001FBB4C18|nr:diguanylate cyclase [Methylobacterium sp. E-045]MCJ2132339.1 diguanylate cyclase [Methylobacterium sp. E-045]
MLEVCADLPSCSPVLIHLDGDIPGQGEITIERSGDAQLIAALRARLDDQARFIDVQARSLAHSRKIFERASAVARIGVWECRLADEALTWTDAVYRMFDLPVGSAVDRETTLGCYSPESRIRLDALRSQAIAERGGFTLDAEIVTVSGNRRWIRLTATVECEEGTPVRIFGMKQDITEEKILADRTRYLAEFDTLTGLPNRTAFYGRLADMDRLGALLLLDLDGFKQVNDTHGHMAGDACLAEVGRRLKETCRHTEFVARIGGDEFGIVVDGTIGTQGLAALAKRIIAAMASPIAWGQGTFTIGVSIGIAITALRSPEDVFAEADMALYAAKAEGRGTFRLAPPPK